MIGAIPRRYVVGINFNGTLVVLLMALQLLKLYTKGTQITTTSAMLAASSTEYIWLCVPIKLFCQKPGNAYYTMEWDGNQNVARLNSMDIKLVRLMLEQGEAPK